MAPWKARKVAQATHRLSKAGAASVDAQLADRIGSCGWRAIETAVAQAIASYDPHLLETRDQQGKAAWNVRLFHRDDGEWAGTSHLDVTGDTLDLTCFHDLVCEQAAQLKALGDTDTLEVRKAKAVGVIANRQAALDLGALLGPDAQSPAETAPVPPPAAKTKLYLHLTLTDLLGADGADSSVRDRVRDRGEVRAGHHRPDQGLGRPVPGHHPTRPRHDPHRRHRRARPTRLDAGTRHPARPALRLPVVHPGRQSLRLDHITPYEENGPPGPDPARRPRRALPKAPPGENLPPMALPPHPAGSYQWTGPHGQTYLVTPHGTIPIPPN